ncbi:MULTISPECIES: N-acetylmuramoyl-L-alanine amidase [unclassified Clostridium]|uniref:N-acetylmuramoyl-L-alanine amidase family protein n=1 Tax=unclassified Clostridium TaxID=2614128 RepID=UPI0018984E27|nr:MULTISPECIES: N-acetylmuramoyl-L-alanine amidase [unclassified Clostridium]MCR1950359.1 N-acetylmuramoyl-L-alanine amidase [Clostridium sp. DSM 100503]
MENQKFNIAYKRKLLYKRKRKRKLILRISLLLSAFCVLSLILLLNNKISNNSNSINKKVTTGSSSETEFIVCIDPGHGDWDAGTKGSTGVLEKDIVLNISLKLGQLLESNKVKVVYTRTNDSLPWLETANDSLKERIKISDVFNADLFISLHCNSNYDDTDAKGLESWYKPSSESSENLAMTIQNALLKLRYTEDRGLKTYKDRDDALAVLELNPSIPVLIELGFLSNYSDERYLKSNRGQEACAKAINEAILSYIENNKEELLKARESKEKK